MEAFCIVSVTRLRMFFGEMAVLGLALTSRLTWDEQDAPEFGALHSHSVDQIFWYLFWYPGQETISHHHCHHTFWCLGLEFQKVNMWYPCREYHPPIEDQHRSTMLPHVARWLLSNCVTRRDTTQVRVLSRRSLEEAINEFPQEKTWVKATKLQGMFFHTEETSRGCGHFSEQELARFEELAVVASEFCHVSL